MSKCAKNQKQNKWLPATAVIVCVLAVGVTLGFMFRKTEPIQNDFERAIVRCEVVEDFDGTIGIKSSIAVRNTGNISANVRIRLVSYWVDADGNMVGKPFEMPTFALADGWSQTAEDTYEYGEVIAPDALTPNLLAKDETITLVTDAEGNHQVLEVFAEAIQSQPSKAKDNWK